jgi:hypothetical protein
MIEVIAEFPALFNARRCLEFVVECYNESRSAISLTKINNSLSNSSRTSVKAMDESHSSKLIARYVLVDFVIFFQAWSSSEQALTNTLVSIK